MSLSTYHQNFVSKSDEDMQRRIAEKEQELVQIFDQVKLEKYDDIISVAVLGCADKRLVQGHKQIFEKVLGKKVELITFDLTIDHLSGEENVVQHDCTLSFPNAHYDITYAHVLLKFIPTEKQFDLIKNSFDALAEGGIAIHVLDREDYETKDLKVSDGYYSVPLDDYKNKLSDLGISFREFPNKYGLAFVLLKQ